MSTLKTPAKNPPSAKKPTPSASKQSNILSFFGKKSASSTPTPLEKKTSVLFLPKDTDPALHESANGSNGNALPSLLKRKKPVPLKSSPPPVLSSDVYGQSSPVRKGKRKVNYAESSEEEDGDVFERIEVATKRNRVRQRRVVEDDEDDEFEVEEAEVPDDDDEMDDFIVDDDDSDVPARSTKKRKRAASKPNPPKRSKHVRSRSLNSADIPSEDVNSRFDNLDLDAIPAGSSCAQWAFDPANPGDKPVTKPDAKKQPKGGKEKAYKSEPEDRYPWLAKILDMNRKAPGDPDYDPSTIYVPPGAWNKFSPFEKQYWEIKQRLWDTVVFFKKGKFYELYENDATIGHQLFDLKLTDRVNMRMVGVPEASLVQWVNQFVAKGFKVARVDQMESALGKEMRERDGEKSAKKADKIIKRELACVLTAGTLVDGGMLQDDMATYCVAIKEAISEEDGTGEKMPVFGLAFVDAATGSFHVAQWTDDVDLTRFETFVAQVNPRELIVEKGGLSTKALRILKNNTGPSTLWNWRKGNGGDFWEAEMTRRELKAGGYFSEETGWPRVLEEHKEDDELMSALGALIQYLRMLKMESSLVSQGNFSWYDPIQKNGTLVLDGQTLINLEIFSNTATGGPEGTLFALLDRCVTPFGKRLLRNWVCHPLYNVNKINERLDAVEALDKDRELRGQFTGYMTKLPDLERLISRIHAGSCRAGDFVRVLEGFEQIEYAVSLMTEMKTSSVLINKLLQGMPDLKKPLHYWETAFDRKRARDDRLMIPSPGIDETFDGSEATISDIKKRLNALLNEKKTELKCRNLKFADVGKEIYQLEVPKATKVPATWQQMSATSSVKRYYFSTLTTLVRELQEAEELHGQVLKESTARFCRKFDEDYDTWLAAIRIISQLDCLVSLAKASASLGTPVCRPKFVDSERSVVHFEELRHPCMASHVPDFIPNSIHLGGKRANISLLTGANAAGKSTVLRMSCIAVIMAQIGCYVPAVSATLTPVDRIMSRLGANDNIFAGQSTFLVELAETKKILSEATNRSLVILDELGRGTSSYDGVAVAQAVLHHVASHIGCVGFFATHYHSLATEFSGHPEITPERMAIHVDDAERRITFLYRLEPGVAEGSFGMHCAAMCGIPKKVIERAEEAAKEGEVTGRLKERVERERGGGYLPLGMLSDVAELLRGEVEGRGVDVLLRAIGSI